MGSCCWVVAAGSDELLMGFLVKYFLAEGSEHTLILITQTES